MYKRKKTIAFILIILWMMIIFLFSNMPGEVSDEKSMFVVNFISMLGLDINSGFADFLNHVVRKSAHFTEYAILFILIFNWLKYYFKLTPALVFSLLFVFLYACTDEFHQLYVPGRSGRFTDVLIDTSGGLFALIITYFYTTRIGHFSKRIRVF